MSQHFLLSAKARTLSLSAVLRMTDEEAETVFRSVRWQDGKAICPHCECPTVYECRRPSGALRFRCKACRKDFSITSGTLSRSTRCRSATTIAVIADFCNEVKGVAAGPEPGSGRAIQDILSVGAQGEARSYRPVGPFLGEPSSRWRAFGGSRIGGIDAGCSPTISMAFQSEKPSSRAIYRTIASRMERTKVKPKEQTRRTSMTFAKGLLGVCWPNIPISASNHARPLT